MKIIAHRGDHTNHQENSLRAIEEAYKIGFAGIETDLRLTKDNEIVICHDSTLKRCFGNNAYISQITLAQAISLGVPTLESLFSTVPSDLQMHLELKSPGLAKVLIAKYKEAIVKRIERICITSFWHDELKSLKTKMPEVMVGAIFAARPVWPLPFEICNSSCAKAAIMPFDMCDRHLVEAMHNRGIEVYAWRIESTNDISIAEGMWLDLVYSDAPTNQNLKTILKKS